LPQRPLPTVEREEMRFLTPTEIVTLAEAIRPSYRALVFVGAYGGLRIGELAGLRRSRVDLLRGTVRVVEIITESPAGCIPARPRRGRAGGRSARRASSSVSSKRTWRAAAARTITSSLRRTVAACGSSRSGTGSGGRPPMRLAGLRIHDLRHTAVALWIGAGASPKEVAARAGHTSVGFPSTVLRPGPVYRTATVYRFSVSS
jgi:integrase